MLIKMVDDHLTMDDVLYKLTNDGGQWYRMIIGQVCDYIPLLEDGRDICRLPVMWYFALMESGIE